MITYRSETLLTSKEKNLLNNILEWYKNNPQHLETFLSIIKGKSNVTCTNLDFIIHNVIDISNKYEVKLHKYTIAYFDVFCRNQKLVFYYGENNSNCFLSSLGQLNFFKWAFENNVIEYANINCDQIDQDKRLFLKNLKNQRSRQIIINDNRLIKDNE
ncbi:hypothetical protein CE11_01027 [Megavirus courdo11]|uniref:Uncharacterized protein n=3 Tax=Megamimivirinae TaxID=3044648 RepID=A0A2L2DNN0_MIMIV|nr:hypothetical protein MegaChil _gp0942 [Megavirus chiliensis]AEQ32832.1 hypothetical protein [Megavirus chiliensis]AFX93053.1 hypothetical protein CE11_01027 [Megavirus courdo11]AVG47778.1 hypothetical protein [Acanthamoeba polyphaga mimivirus]